MPAHQTIQIASVNMRKRNDASHSLLNSNTTAHLLLIQEPWFDRIGTARDDNAREGVAVRGGAACPLWELIYPGYTETKNPKVMAYARKPTQHTANIPRFSVVPRLDICTHHCVQVLDIVFDDDETWRVINFYRDDRDDSSMQTLLALDIDALSPTLIVGDFNTDSRMWSLPGATHSRFTTRVEEWAARNLLELANTPGVITRKGAANERNSVLDLAWYNEAATQDSTFTDLKVDWDGSHGSDHAMLTLSGNKREEVPSLNYGGNLGFVVDPEKGEEWTQAFKARSFHYLFQPVPSPDEVEAAAASLTEDFCQTNEEILRRRRPAHPKASPWWNAACAIAAKALQEAQDVEPRKQARARLKGTVRAAKRKWADEYIEKAQLWEVAAWRHGRKLSKVPSLQGPDGLVHGHEEVADILSQRFFPRSPMEVPPHFPDDPLPHPPRQLARIDKTLVEPLLRKAASRSAPGQSGHTWTLLKWAWEADSERIVSLFEACLKAGHHPRLWKEAVVCVIPKPKRSDYTLAKNFRPISLLECLGKLLEKVVAKLIYRDMSKHALVPTTQFGGRNASSTLDAGLTLLHDIQAAHQAGLRSGILLFDIQGFFDNINHERLIQTFSDLGFAPELVMWCRSFLKDRTVRLKFNGKTSDPFAFTTGTPQGSPVSPVLSIIYTSPLLHKMRSWIDSSLGMYIDDGVIFACGRDWESIESTMRNGYSECIEWLTRAGLNVEPDKSELLFFKKRGEQLDPPCYIHLPNPLLNTYYRVQATNTLRYLGFYFDDRLNWKHHVDVVCNRTRASLKALQLLGNSVRGLDQANWRLAYNAICLPVLTYGCQLWYKGKQVTLVKKLQVVQNEAVRIISGTFRTAPREPLHHLLAILPMDVRLTLLLKKTALRLYKVPRESQLLARLGDAWHTQDPNDLPLPTPNRTGATTTLRALAARVPPNGPRIDPFPDTPHGAPTWNGRAEVISKHPTWDYELVTNALTEACRAGHATNVYCNALVSNKDREDGKQLGAASAVLYHQGREAAHTEEVFGEAVTESDAMTRALTPGLDALALFLATKPASFQTQVNFLIPSVPALNRALDASAHEEQAAAINHLERLGEFFNSHPSIKVKLQWLPRKSPFVGFRRARQLAFEAIRTADPTELREPPSIKKQEDTAKREAIATLEDRYYNNPRTSFAYKTALREPPNGKAHHAFKIIPDAGGSQAPNARYGDHENKAKFSRTTHTTLLRFITGHAFTGEHTQRFYPPHTQDDIACPCGEPLQTIEHILLQCPLYIAARRRHLVANGRPRTLPQLFANSKRVQEVLRFLEETGACAKPRARWEPD
jgi:hypothetical protein